MTDKLKQAARALSKIVRTCTKGLWVAPALVGDTSSRTMLPIVVFSPFLHGPNNMLSV